MKQRIHSRAGHEIACGGTRVPPAAATSRALLAAALLLLPACQPPAAQRPETPPLDITFTNVTNEANLTFQHHNGRSGKKWLPETLGSGAAFLDYNGDQYPDIYLVNSQSWTPDPENPTTGHLYRNNQDGTFTDVTAETGLAEEFYGMGAAVADYDADGFPDLYVTALGPDRLYRNIDGERFEEVAGATGIANPDMGTSAAFVDYDQDGHIDLYVANYVEWSPEADLWCSLDGETKSYCTPESYDGVSSRLFRNEGDGTFEDATETAGVFDDTSKALGIVVFDYDADGDPDLFEANDTQPNKLWENQGDGTFTDIGLSAAVAFAEDGKARGAMGVDAGDYDGSGREHLLVGNFSNEMLNLFHNEGSGLFVDEAPASEIGRESLLSLTFGTFFFDYDLDGRLDIFAANGHLENDIQRVQPNVTFAQAPLLFRNGGDGKFALANPHIGDDLIQPVVARGAAYADYDRDGDLDILVTTNDGPAALFRNDGGNANHWLRVRLVGAPPNTSALGAIVTLKAESSTQRRMVRSGSSYASQSELTATFGLGATAAVESLTVTWPNGAEETVPVESVDQEVTVRQQP